MIFTYKIKTDKLEAEGEIEATDREVAENLLREQYKTTNFRNPAMGQEQSVKSLEINPKQA